MTGYVPRNPLQRARRAARWLRAAYWTLRYVDERKRFPAFRIVGACSLRVTKRRGARLRVDDQVVLWSHYGNRGHASILLQSDALMHVRDEFKLGPGTKVKVAPGGVLDIAGRGAYKSSHVLGESTIAAREEIVLGEGVGTGLGVLITDSDWHKIRGRTETSPVSVGKNAYLATNCMILKGSTIGDNCVLGAATVVAGKAIPSGSLVAGNPGRVRANGISWEF